MEPTNDEPVGPVDDVFIGHVRENTLALTNGNDSRAVDLRSYFNDDEDKGYLKYSIESISVDEGAGGDGGDVPGGVFSQGPTIDDENDILYYAVAEEYYENIQVTVTVTATDNGVTVGEEGEEKSITGTFIIDIENGDIAGGPGGDAGFGLLEIDEEEEDPGDPGGDDEITSYSNANLEIAGLPEELEESHGALVVLNNDLEEANSKQITHQVGPFEDLKELVGINDNEEDRDLAHVLANPARPQDTRSAIFKIDVGFEGFQEHLFERVEFGGTFTFTFPEEVKAWIRPGFAYIFGLGGAQEVYDHPADNPDAPPRLVELESGKAYELYHENVLEHPGHLHGLFGGIPIVIEGLEEGVDGVKEAMAEVSASFDGEIRLIDLEGNVEISADVSGDDAVGANVIQVDLNIVDDGDQIIGELDVSDYDENRIPVDIVLNSRDDDFDGVLDFHDGFDLDENNDLDDVVGPADAVDETVGFTPISISIPDGLDIEESTLTFTFNASDPNEAAIVDGNPQNDEGGLRIWTKDKTAERDKAWVKDGGDAIIYTDESGIIEYSLDELGVESDYSDGKITLFIEGVRPGQYGIKVNLKPIVEVPEGADPIGDPTQAWRYVDKILVNVREEISVKAVDRFAAEPTDDTTEVDDGQFIISRGEGVVYLDHAGAEEDGDGEGAGAKFHWRSPLQPIESNDPNEDPDANSEAEMLAFNTHGAETRLGDANVYYKIVRDDGVPTATSPFVAGEGADYQDDVDNPLVVDGIAGIGIATILQDESSVTVVVTPTDEYSDSFVRSYANGQTKQIHFNLATNEWDEAVTLEIITQEEYFELFELHVQENEDGDDEPFIRGFQLPSPDQFYIPKGKLDEVDETTPIEDGDDEVILYRDTVFILDTDFFNTDDTRNLDIESTGLTAASTGNGIVDVSIRDGSLELLVPLGPRTPTYRSNDNLVPIAEIELTFPWDGEAVTNTKAVLTFAGIEGEETEFDLSRLESFFGNEVFGTGVDAENFNPYRSVRLVVVGPADLADSIPSGHHDYNVVFTTEVDRIDEDGNEITVDVTRTVRGSTEFVNRVGEDHGWSEFGDRWTLEELSRIVPSDEITLGQNATEGVTTDLGTVTSGSSNLTTQGASSETSFAVIRGDNTSANYEVEPDFETASTLDVAENYWELVPEEGWLRNNAQQFAYSGGGLQERVHKIEWVFEGQYEAGKPVQIFVS